MDSHGGLFVTAVGFPILGVISVSKSGGLHELSKKVNRTFAMVFTVLIYLSIGPCLGIPRAGSLPFEMAVAPFYQRICIKYLGIIFIYTFIFHGSILVMFNTIKTCKSYGESFDTDI